MQRVMSFGVLMLISLTAQLPTAGAAPSKPAFFSTSNGAIRGYDTVAYFTDSRAIKGQNEFKHSWSGGDWYFSNRENLDQFKSDPESFAPQYGGYCAFAMSKGAYASGDPEAWTIHDGKLYLNYSKSVRRTWSKNISKYIKLADRNWKRFRNGT